MSKIYHVPSPQLPSPPPLPQMGILLQHREACCSALAFFCRLLERRVIEASPPGADRTLQTALEPRGPMLTRWRVGCGGDAPAV